MFKLRNKINYTPIIYLIVLVVLLILIINSGLIFNITKSMPVGLYYRTGHKNNIKIGDIVSVELPLYLQSYGVKRGYLDNMKTKLLKEIIAIPGDKIYINDDKIIIGQKEYKAGLYNKDIHGRKLNIYKKGEFINTGYWLYGYGDYKNSWDSRYFGPVDLINIKSKIIPILTF